MVPEFLNILGSSHFRFHYQSFRFRLIWSRNGTEMELKQYQIEIYVNNPLKTLYRKHEIKNQEPKPKHQNLYRGTAGTEASIPKMGLNWEIGTIPTLMYLLATFAYNA